VEVSTLSGGARGYAVVTNHGPESQSVLVTASVPLHVVTRITAGGTAKVQVVGTTFKVDIGAYEGLVFEWQ
jgi:hypothetical protein